MAFKAKTMIASPPFMSPEPAPFPMLSLRTKRWFSPSKTVSRWPISSMRGEPFFPACVATRCPARFIDGGTSAHRVVKPSESRVAPITRPTSRTPVTFSEPLGMLTRRSR
jgi:hypothetical protein